MPKDEIVPSEIDDYFRHRELRGYVHDMGAAMQGGIGGHAGLFSNAEEVYYIMQMYLQKGMSMDMNLLLQKLSMNLIHVTIVIRETEEGLDLINLS